ncbi:MULTISPECIES: hypothetical protein, partial [unclassified Exiguobacterium]|uniref:hypothetical protein n=1 Tax=unclassified Exiguobacterium TaxID=2644629 RepID=UPI001358E1CF
MTKQSKPMTDRQKGRANVLRGATLATLLAGSLLGAQPTGAEETGPAPLSTREALTPFESSLALLTDLEAPVPIDYYQGQDRVTGTVAPDVK